MSHSSKSHTNINNRALLYAYGEIRYSARVRIHMYNTCSSPVSQVNIPKNRTHLSRGGMQNTLNIIIGNKCNKKRLEQFVDKSIVLCSFLYFRSPHVEYMDRWGMWRESWGKEKIKFTSPSKVPVSVCGST